MLYTLFQPVNAKIFDPFKSLYAGWGSLKFRNLRDFFQNLSNFLLFSMLLLPLFQWKKDFIEFFDKISKNTETFLSSLN